MLITPPDRIAIELNPPRRRRLEANIAGYGAHPNIAIELQLVDDLAIGETIQSAAARLDLSPPIRVQRVTRDQTTPGAIMQ